MDPPVLFSLPTEVLFYIFLFLTETDLLALCHTCKHLHYDIMNDDAVWKRFITDEVRSLELQPQQVSPDNPLPDLGLCENRKHLMRKRRLLSNWRNQKCVKSEVDVGDRYRTREVLFYRNNYVLKVTVKHLELWDISSVLVLQFSLDILLGLQNPECYIIADKLVICLPKCVYVFQVNIHDTCFSFLYWFHPKENHVMNNEFPGIVEKRNFPLSEKVFFGIGNHLAYFEPPDGSRKNPALHLWDIAESCKVGVFVAPSLVRYLYFDSCHDNDLIIKTKKYSPENVIFKFNCVTKRFSHPVVLRPNENVQLYHKNNVVTSRFEPITGQQEYARIFSVYDFDSSVKLAEKIFSPSYRTVDKLYFHEGKFTLCSNIQVLIVDALSLQTLCTMPRARPEYWKARLISVFGLWCLLVAGEDYKELEVWDVSNNTPTLLKHTQGVDHVWPFFSAKGEAPFSKLLHYPHRARFESNFNMSVRHFW